MEVNWDYTELAAYYDKRADYSAKALDRLYATTRMASGARVADIGAGTGKLAVPLARRGLVVFAVEPNAAMRGFGIRNSHGLRVRWIDGTGEHTGLPTSAFQLATFGSSFNVVDQQRALVEAARILTSEGWFACMWNHRDLDDDLQAEVEAIIREELPEYNYGARRQDPTPIIGASGLFEPVEAVEERFVVKVPPTDYVKAWRSHATLQRQAGARFSVIIARIEQALGSKDSLSVPYFTRLWLAARAVSKSV